MQMVKLQKQTVILYGCIKYRLSTSIVLSIFPLKYKYLILNIKLSLEQNNLSKIQCNNQYSNTMVQLCSATLSYWCGNSSPCLFISYNCKFFLCRFLYLLIFLGIYILYISKKDFSFNWFYCILNCAFIGLLWLIPWYACTVIIKTALLLYQCRF